MIFDTHAHYDDEAFDNDRDEILSGLGSNGVDYVVNVAADMKGIESGAALAEKYPRVYSSAGVHPSECADLDEKDLEIIREAAALPKTVAIGEIGLDYHGDEPNREQQKFWFKRQLEIASKCDLPVIIHSRDAAQDTMDILKEHRVRVDGPQGVIHCYSYSSEMAVMYVKMGYYIGIGGVVTFKNARKVREAVAILPLERIVLETDCPYMAPEPLRGERNSSLNLPFVAAQIARIKNITTDEVINVTEKNAENLYGIH
ncbi:MAG: TatD family hydrolase [Lachnospiraceae bacterium]|nr:TatD family hydrolase [Lachnospiraceae bacterium]